MQESFDEVWARYFLGIAREVAKNTKCRSRAVGAVLVQGKSIISSGYNGPPAGMRPCDERWCNDMLYDDLHYQMKLSGELETEAEYAERTASWLMVEQPIGKCPRRVLGFAPGQGLGICVAGHGERNAIIQAAKLGIRTEGATLYCWCGVPCNPCMVEIINAGIREIVCLKKDQDYDDLARVTAKECGVSIREVEIEG